MIASSALSRHRPALTIRYLLICVTITRLARNAIRIERKGCRYSTAAFATTSNPLTVPGQPLLTGLELSE
jgi:hypothetical protein